MHKRLVVSAGLRTGVLLAAASLPLGAQVGYVITTVAGTLTPPTPMPALSVSVGRVQGVATDSAGNLYFSSATFNCVFKVDSGGVMTRAAGTGQQGYSGDGGPATDAQLNQPYGLAVDSAGNLYITDQGNDRVRRVSPAGIITTVAGNGSCCYSGDGGPATSAALWGPEGIAVDSAGNLYIADFDNHRVRKVSPAGVITTVAGDGSRDYSGDGGPATSAGLSPIGVAVGSAGDLYIADPSGCRVRQVSPAGIITTVAGESSYGYSGDGGPATSAELYFPTGVAVDPAGSLYVVDTPNGRVRKVSTTGIISTVAGDGGSGYSGDGGSAIYTTLNNPTGVATDSAGNLYIADTDNYRVRKVSPAGIITTVAGNGAPSYLGDGGPAVSAQLNYPYGVTVDPEDNLYIADTVSSRVRRVSPAGIITTVAGNGSCCYSGDGGSASSAALLSPSGVAVDSTGSLYIADAFDNRVRKVSTSGIITTVAGSGPLGYTGEPDYSGDGGPATSATFSGPYGVAVDAAGNLYIADAFNQRVRKVSASGTITTVAGNGTLGYSGDGGPATSAMLAQPFGVAVDAAGNLYIADSSNFRVRKVNPSGVISTVAGNGTWGSSGDGGPATSAMLSTPSGVALDSAGNLYIADTGICLVRKVSPAGIITTIAGNGSQGYSGDGGPATNAQLHFPTGVTADAAGNVYVADSVNNVIRRLRPSPTRGRHDR